MREMPRRLRATVGVCVGAGLLAVALLAATASNGEHGEKVVALYGEVTPCRLPSLLPRDNVPRSHREPLTQKPAILDASASGREPPPQNRFSRTNPET